MEGLIGITYRCNAKCYMCNTWKFPTKKEAELKLEYYEKLPQMKFTNITGGEPFLREDVGEIVKLIKRKTKRIVISTNGFFTERILAFAEKNPDVGVRISLEGLSETNDKLRGIKHGFDRGLRTLIELKAMGLKDIGFGITVSDSNAGDLLALYKLAHAMRVEFATAVLHNSYYFHKFDNRINDKDKVVLEFQKLIGEFFSTGKIKNWYRAYFNYGIINYIHGGERLLPCKVGTDVFFMDPFGEVRPCNAMEESMGNIKEVDFMKIWNGEKARAVREKVAKCDKHCWMMGSVAPAIKQNMLKTTLWILKNRKCYKQISEKN